jgi:hypothetical protein
MKRTIILLPLFLVTLLSATNAENSKGARAVPHRVTGELKGTLTFVPFPDFDQPFDVDTIGFASGIVKGLGQTHLFTFHRPTPQWTVIDGHVWMVAAGGDTIRCVYEGTTEPGAESDQLIGRASWVVTGGTGRFADASGTINATAYVTVIGFDVFEWPVAWVVEGTINY